VTWVNRDGVPHDATSDDGRWTTGMLNPGQGRSLVFDDLGEFEYFCTIHPDMKAKLVVRSDSAAAETNTEDRQYRQEGGL
jgi:plastocyanin